MKINDIKAELQARGRSGKGKKDELQKELFSMLRGTIKLLPLLHNSDQSALWAISCKSFPWMHWCCVMMDVFYDVVWG